MRRDQEGPRRQGLGNDSLVEFSLLQIVIIHGIESNFTSWLVLDNYNHEYLLWRSSSSMCFLVFRYFMGFFVVSIFKIPLPTEQVVKIFKLTRASMSTICIRARVGTHKVEIQNGRERELPFFKASLFYFRTSFPFLFFINMKQGWMGGNFVY